MAETASAPKAPPYQLPGVPSGYPRKHEFGKPFGNGPYCGKDVLSPFTGIKTKCGFPASAPCHEQRARG